MEYNKENRFIPQSILGGNLRSFDHLPKKKGAQMRAIWRPSDKGRHSKNRFF